MKERPYITCRELIDFLGEYLGGSLAAGARCEFERHLKVCPSCLAYLESYRRTIELGREALQPSEKPAQAPETLVHAIRQARLRASGAQHLPRR